ncbi:hypothetical protein, partial [Methylocaldum sp.]|uniref:hypothetical protein n=1 Tax=Methylocaldum sp. TaxID=1969727 RepID=UPI0032207311
MTPPARRGLREPKADFRVQFLQHDRIAAESSHRRPETPMNALLPVAVTTLGLLLGGPPADDARSEAKPVAPGA